ncbi:MAG: GGDEF domain-containing protein [Bacteroidetes bacterium SW_7_64_58]|nr:MAG: GGDEF domain-containing protein [Bacteroidetes bacterium SW_7_64_58]
MLRSLLALLAVLVVGLAVLFSRPWLYVVTGVILAGALGLLGWWLWSTYATDEPERPRPSPEPDASDPSLDEMGIVDIQPETADADLAQEEPTQEDRTKSEPVESSAPSAPGPALATQKPSADQDETTERPTTTEAAEAEPPPDPHEAPVLDPLLESARAALDARTVGLLVQEEVALTYRIEALASTHSAVQRSGSFDTQTPLITATMSRQSVTIRTLAEEEVAIEDLGYYEAPPSVDHLAVAPVSQPDSSTTTFLLADTSEGADLRASRARTLLEHFAETVSLLLDIGRSVPERAAADDPDTGSAGPEEPGSTTMVTDLDGEETEDPRPRSEIIGEEMEAAQSASEDLALALVHLNRAESIARRGEEAVASAERLFQARLEQIASNQRIERFGELTYGIFFRKGAGALEPWMANFESTMAQEQGELEGGVSVGVAVWDEETPEALRSEATKALREAYETGTCTIVT